MEHPGFPEGSEVRSCRVTVTLAAPEATGVQSTVRGFVQLDSGVTARQQQHVISMKQGNTVARFSGPISRDYVTQAQGTLAVTPVPHLSHTWHKYLSRTCPVPGPGVG